ncbi:fungal-specific transcription factor domain-containing protein [Dactylonectria estremocensis]|uniref:Fungal-specific transcription factor domain-containing protein n=1 Tax=Dactylonectria estremocensis TaxID=1079267 RepID=A0A9P9J0V5_9HYPO|nr:fungal-specific transcription factor domain-containing protein [Dactylonectria estremocensis]
MSTVLPTRERASADAALPASSAASTSATASFSSQPLMPRRLLACVLCHQRKVKCERKFPCSNCIKSGTQCVPTTMVPRQPRRRRFPERALLDRLRNYEDLLRKNNVRFEPLHKDWNADRESPNADVNHDSGDENPSSTTRTASSSLSPNSRAEVAQETKDFWHVIRQGLRDPDEEDLFPDNDENHASSREIWDQMFDDTDHLLFGSRKTAVDLSALQPEPVHIFRLWQLYLDNVNPLLKVTHTPTLQPKIIAAMGNLSQLGPSLEALLFSIYCMALQTISSDECVSIFDAPKADLLVRYQFGAQQALANCNYLRTNDRLCLTALYLYLVSVSSSTNPRSLSAILGVAIRIALRMGLHNELDNAKCAPLEAEMRRRLWWSLIVFDSRIGELADHKSTGISPTWNCRIPLNVNESELRPEIKEPPPLEPELKSTEALFVVVRSEMSDFLRHTAFYLDFSSPALKPLAKNAQHGLMPEGSELDSLEEMVNNKYLKFCDPEIPLHYITIWTARGTLAKWRIVEYFWRSFESSAKPSDAELDAIMVHTIAMLESDTKLMTSPLTKGYRWLLEKYFPLPAYMQIARDLRQRPISQKAERAWEVMSENFDARFNTNFDTTHSPIFKFFNKIIIEVWTTRAAELKRLGEVVTLPVIVTRINEASLYALQDKQSINPAQVDDVADVSVDSGSVQTPMAFYTHSFPYAMDWQDNTDTADVGVGMGTLASGHLSDDDTNRLDWASMIWGLGEHNGQP